ncbi:VOC family protein [Solicola sp. PLA-1-18]|uniref:VOC family protein n=1 Tax=Solicola sp. PLA-1-18 TaxID=3380532 RepID=UPI003B7FB25B
MRLDHLSFAAGPEGLAETAARLSEMLDAKSFDGGVHPRFGTRNVIIPVAGGKFIEVVEVLDHPASDKAPFGQAVRARSEAGGGWLGWVVSVDDIEPVERRIGRHAVLGNRRRPDGFNLQWRQIGVRGLQSDPQLPFVICWDVPADEHPSHGTRNEISLTALEIAGSPQRVSDWLGEPALEALEDLEVRWVAPHGTPGIVAAQFHGPAGVVRI